VPSGVAGLEKENSMNVTKPFALVAALALVVAGCASKDEKVCSDFCGAGAACVSGQCVALSQDCDPACSSNEACLMTGGTATCVAVCGDAQVWNPTTQKCDLQIAMDHSRYFGGFSDTELTNGPAVTAQCLNCHAIEAGQMAGSAHFKWLGPTPLLAGHESGTAEAGKKNLINNFCIAVASNETRCTQCHAGYGDAAGAGTPGYDMTQLGRVDCLICHANLSTGYVKATANWGAADAAGNATTCGTCAATEVCWNDGATTACVPKTSRFKAAAQSVGRPARTNCGTCHFYAGGGDNVKMGDLASSLKTPTMAVDVHMGSDGGNLVCVDCHATAQHRIFGAGVSVAVSEGRTACTDCHDATAATFTAITTHRASHLAKLACQTCHIPTFSRQLRTKVRWEWQLAGYKDCKFPVSAADEVAWGDLDTDGNGFADALTCAAISASPSASWTGADGKHYEYDWRKGVFRKEDLVHPVYKYADGKGTHLTVTDSFVESGTPADPVIIAAPTATSTTVGAKIAPFKEMAGTQAAMVDKSFLIVPYLYPMNDSTGTKVPGALWDGPTLLATGETPTTLQAKWTTLLTVGARKAGQIGASASIDASAWGWLETRMYMNINHEVGPKADALGKAGCADCHGSSPVVPICTMPGVTCTW
jgi:hypothetical protein